ncbi:hypothetical protein L484_018286 [Morus notabilis]|uniref:Uncharacterized protein n=1 Tax=Morus notabilis TaxID=981085 RepID=W9SAP5_9ROSA|nr:hypothetical protein L484_018286 [Morus notabilis]
MHRNHKSLLGFRLISMDLNLKANSHRDPKPMQLRLNSLGPGLGTSSIRMNFCITLLDEISSKFVSL